MGACDFRDFVARTDTIQTAKDAFQAAVEDARYEHGSGGYTGTIAEKHNYVMRGPGGPVSRLEAEAIADAMFAGDNWPDKWGPADCLAVGEQQVKTREVSKTIKVDGEKGLYLHDLGPAVLAAMGAVDGETVTAFKVDGDDRTYRTKAKRNTGKAERVFRVGDRGFGALAEAIAAIEVVENAAIARQAERGEWGYHNGIAKTLSIVEEVRRGGLPAATVTTELVSRKVKFTATLSKPVGPVGPVIGWLFYGLASS